MPSSVSRFFRVRVEFELDYDSENSAEPRLAWF